MIFSDLAMEVAEFLNLKFNKWPLIINCFILFSITQLYNKLIFL
jgi:hypothetical protein